MTLGAQTSGPEANFGAWVEDKELELAGWEEPGLDPYQLCQLSTVPF